MMVVLISLMVYGSGLTAGETHSPWKAMLFSAVVPGGGQWYNRKIPKALIIGGLESAMLGGSWYYHSEYRSSQAQSDLNQSNLLLFGGVVMLGYSILDAYIDAHFLAYERIRLETVRRDRRFTVRLAYSF